MTKIFRIAAKPVAAAIALVGLLGLTACGGSSSRNVDLDPDDLKYAHDARTGLCFAFTGSGKVLSAETTGIAVAQVPCTPKVMAIVTGKPVASTVRRSNRAAPTVAGSTPTRP